jgi:hypothetical protein
MSKTRNAPQVRELQDSELELVSGGAHFVCTLDGTLKCTIVLDPPPPPPPPSK